MNAPLNEEGLSRWLESFGVRTQGISAEEAQVNVDGARSQCALMC